MVSFRKKNIIGLLQHEHYLVDQDNFFFDGLDVLFVNDLMMRFTFIFDVLYFDELDVIFMNNSIYDDL